MFPIYVFDTPPRSFSTLFFPLPPIPSSHTSTFSCVCASLGSLRRVQKGEATERRRIDKPVQKTRTFLTSSLIELWCLPTLFAGIWGSRRLFLEHLPLLHI